MKKYLIIVVLMISAKCVSGQGMAVVNPVADPILAGMAATQQIQTQMQVFEKLAKTTVGVVGGLESVKRLIGIINALSCTTADFNFYMQLIYNSPFWNCWLEDDLNRIIGTMMAVVDVVNTILSVAISADPADRLAIVNDALDRYFDLEIQMRLRISSVYHIMRQQQISSFNRQGALNLANMTLTRR